MKLAKNIIPVVFALSFAVSCGGKNDTDKKNGFMIVTSFYPVYIVAKNVADGVDGVRVVNMTPPVTGCLHDYSITASDMMKLENASVFLYNGAGMESFIEKIAVKYPALKRSSLTDGIKLLGGKGEPNPHVWVSVTNVIRMVENCAAVLSEADSRNAASYGRNAARYIGELKALKRDIDSALKGYSGRRIITFHEAFPYFAAEYNLTIAAVIEREPGSEPSARELSETINLVRREGIKHLFAEPQYPHSAADIIARETGASIYILDPAVTGDDDKGAYIKIMRKNLTVLTDAFSKQ